MRVDKRQFSSKSLTSDHLKPQVWGSSLLSGPRRLPGKYVRDGGGGGKGGTRGKREHVIVRPRV